jgi:hypothetical protein
VQAALGCAADSAYGQLKALAALGLAHQVARQLGVVRCRYFGTPEQAQAWQQANTHVGEGLEAKGAVVKAGGPVLLDVQKPLRSRARQPGVMAPEILASRKAVIQAERNRVVPAKPSRPAGVVLGAPVAPTGAAVVPAHVVPSVGRAAGYDPRYQVNPADRPFGAGFSAVGVGRDVQNGEAWA